MSAAEVLVCRACGTPMRHAEGRFVCPSCGAELELDEMGQEVWHVPAQA